MTQFADFSMPYETKRRSAQMTRDATLSQNAFSRFLSQQRGTRDLADLERNAVGGLEKLGGGYAKRGLRHSGIFQQGQAEYGQQWMQGRQDVNDGLMQAMRQYDMSDSTANATYMSTEADLQQQKQAEILAMASQLQAFKPFLGG